MVTIIGNAVSPYVRKVLCILTMKGVEFDTAPIVPFFGDDEFGRLSPLRRIPVLIDGDAVINDSTVIAHYLEETRPAAPILPKEPALRARARWLEEFADGRMGDIFLWRGFGAVVVAPAVFGAPRDLDAFRTLLATEVVEIMDYLESEAPDAGFFCGAFGLADISIAAMFRNLSYARWTPDAARWPKTCAWLARADSEPALARVNAWSDALARTPPLEQRARAAEIGMRLSPKSYLADTPRKGPMTRIS